MTIKEAFYTALILIFSSSCNNMEKINTDKEIDFQGHRGARGLLPENSIPAFFKAIDLGVTTLELDVVITKDNHVLVSHDPYMSHIICKDAEGKNFDEITAKEKYNIFQMTLEEVQSFDCGTTPHPNFPNQELKSVHKPLLKEVISEIESYIANNKLPKVNYNIEIKSTAEGDRIYHPDVTEFVDIVMKMLNQDELIERITIQSFDYRALVHIKDNYHHFKLSYLVENEMSIDENLEQLGFVPDIYSPYYKRIAKEDIDYLHENGMKVVPWTINEKADIIKYINWGADGIISDYPNIFNELK